ncbi:MAG TPA: hypothetical protein VE422_45970 [Terriglobia bacterium]|nr:hypothetical protein [Terriglobia bacterium]
MAIELKNVFFGKRNSPSSAVAPVWINFGQERKELGGGAATEKDSRKSPIVIITGLLPNDPIEIEAQFKTPPNENFRVTVESEFLSLAEEGKANNAMLGSISRVHCVSGEEGEAKQRLTFDMGDDKTRTNLTCVVYGDVTLKWKMEPDSGEEFSVAETKHRLYTLLSPPGSPWSADFSDDHRWIWTDVLEFACRWSAGEKTLDGVAARITDAVHGLGRVPESQGGLRYDSGPRYTIDDTFKCDDFLRHLCGQNTTSLVNCSDLATIVSTFSNALGCRLLQARCSAGKTKPILLIGSDEPRAMDFVFHEIVWDGATLKTDRVWDACTSLSDRRGPAGPTKQEVFRTYSKRLYEGAVEAEGPPFTTNRIVRDRIAPQFVPQVVDLKNFPLQPDMATPATVVMADTDVPDPVSEEDLANVLKNQQAQKRNPVGAVYVNEQRWEWKLRPTGEGCVSMRLSSFDTARDARQFLKVQLKKLSESYELLDGKPGHGFLSKQETSLFYQVGRVVITAQVDYGRGRLRELFQKLLDEKACPDDD